MSKFNIGDRVMMIENGEIRKGVVHNVFDSVPVIIVEFEGGNIEKVAVDRLALEPKTEVKPEAEAHEKKTEFIDAVNYVTSPEGMLGDKVTEVDPMSLMIKGMAVSIVGFKISDKLYGDNDVIEITREQLKEVIAEKTNPIAMAESTGGKMSTTSVFPIAILSALVLTKLVHILFDEADNE